MITNNSIILDLKKVQWGRFYYQNQYENKTRLKPKGHSVRGITFNENDKVLMGERGETMLQYAMKHNLLDVWYPIVEFQLTANHCIKYSGEKAIQMYKAWCSKIFKNN